MSKSLTKKQRNAILTVLVIITAPIWFSWCVFCWLANGLEPWPWGNALSHTKETDHEG